MIASRAALLTGALAAATIACGNKRDHQPAPALPADAAPAQPRFQHWQEAIAAEKSRSYARVPLFDPSPGAAAEDYLAAVKVDLPIDVYSAAEAIIAGTSSWQKAPDVVKQYAASATARGVADAILKGASRTDGTSVVHMSSDILPVIAGNPNIVVILVALAEADAGDYAQACRYLLALQRLAQDISRGAPLVASLVTRTYQHHSARHLRALATNRKLSTADLEEIVGAYGRLVETQVSMGEILRVETLVAAARAMERQLPIGEPESRRDEALARLAIQLAIADTIDEKPNLADKIAYFEAESCRDAASDQSCRALTRHLIALALRDANFLATYVALALELDRRGRGKLAAELPLLAPKTIATIPDDPVSGASFTYTRVGRSMVLQRGATALDGPDVEAREIPVP